MSTTDWRSTALWVWPIGMVYGSFIAGLDAVPGSSSTNRSPRRSCGTKVAVASLCSGSTSRSTSILTTA